MSRKEAYQLLISLFLRLRGGKSIFDEGVSPFSFFGKKWIVHLRNNKDLGSKKTIKRSNHDQG
jgi:hypothetical protein